MFVVSDDDDRDDENKRSCAGTNNYDKLDW